MTVINCSVHQDHHRRQQQQQIKNILMQNWKYFKIKKKIFSRHK